MITDIRKFSLATGLVVLVFLSSRANGISIPFFGSFGRSSRQQQQPVLYNEQKEGRIINADHGGSGGALSSSSQTASLAGGSFVGPSPWISGTRDQFIRDQLVILHPDSHLNREAWKESGYLNSDSGSSKDFIGVSNNNGGMLPSARTPPGRLRKPARKSKQHTAPSKTVSGGDSGASINQESSSNRDLPASANGGGGQYDFLPIPMTYNRDLNQNLGSDMTSSDGDLSMIQHDPIFVPANNYLMPFSTPIFPYSPRAISNYANHAALPPDAMIQFLKSPEQELSPMSRPQVKLPFPLSHDCSANSGSGGSKPLQFVVLPIVEPVAPLKPIFPKPPFLSSQYGQFPYISPFNYFNKKPPVFPISNLDGSSGNGVGQGGGGSSGQFVPILNRPAPPLPFVFVQSLPLELIGHNVEMDVLNSSPSIISESKINDVSPIAAPPQQQQPSPTQQVQSGAPSSVSENNPNPSRPLPLIVIEKVKTPGQPPSAPVAPAAAVVEISKQSLSKNGGGSGSSPLSSISVIKPITAPGSEPPTPQQQHEIHKTIEKLVPVAAAVLENVEKQQQQQQQKDKKDQDTAPISSPLPLIASSDQAIASSATAKPIDQVKDNEQNKSSSLRPPLRPDPTKESVKIPEKNTGVSSASEEIMGLSVNPTSMTEVEITEA